MEHSRLFVDSTGGEWEVYDETQWSIAWALDWEYPPQPDNPGLLFDSKLQIAYALGVAEPVSVMVDTFATSTVPESAIMSAVRDVFDLTPKGIINALDLRKPIYSPTSAYGHFGRSPKKNGKGTLFTWERLDRVADLKKAVESK